MMLRIPRMLRKGRPGKRSWVCCETLLGGFADNFKAAQDGILLLGVGLKSRLVSAFQIGPDAEA